MLDTDALQSAIFNSANFSSIATDARGVIQIFNVGAERMLGYAAADVVNKITPADISDPQELIARATALSTELGTAISPGFQALVFKASRGIEDIYELTYIRKDGSRFPAVVSVTALRDAVNNTVIGYLLIGTDNTARKNAEEALLKAGALQYAIFNSASFSSIATDARGVIQIFNVGAERMLGYAADEVMNKITPAEISDPQELIARAHTLSAELSTPITPGFEALVFKASRGIEDIYELTYVRKDGSRFPAVVSVTALRDPANAIIGYLLIGTDNTARQQIEAERMKLEQALKMEQALKQKNVELQDATRMKSEFIANMSHELRTPLNAIIGFSEVLRDGLVGELSERQRGFVTDIFTSGNHLLSLINDILDLSKVEAGKMVLDLEPVQLAAVFANSASMVREQAASRNVQVTVDAGSELGLELDADGRRVRQIVYNLLANAVKFTLDGGQVRLEAEQVPRAAVGQPASVWPGRSVPLADSEFDEFIRISVIDTGIGIPPQRLAQLFQPFSQIDSGLARRFEGTGLGLVMVKLLAELHGGTVGVESALGEGSRFTAWLPYRVPGQSVLPARAGEPDLAVTDAVRTVLVVEDNLKAAELVRVQLEAEGFTVVHAASAEAALVLADRQPLSLITIDIMLPQMDGWELLSRLKALPGLSRVPVVIISIVADRLKGFSLGAAAVLEKPITRQNLYDALVVLDLVPVATGRSLKILIIDDDPKAVELAAVRVTGLAGNLLRAYGGREGIATAQRELPDLIVLDLIMPEVSGFDVVETLQRDPATAQIPVVVVTAKTITDDDRRQLSGQVTAVMQKAAFNPDVFLAEVRRALSGRGAVDRVESTAD